MHLPLYSQSCFFGFAIINAGSLDIISSAPKHAARFISSIVRTDAPTQGWTPCAIRALESLAYVGSAAIDTVRKVYFDAVLFSSAGFDDNVVSDWSEGETELRRVVLEQSAKRYFLADHTKRGKRYTHIVCRINELDKIICE